jgi:hypothetical protein
MYRKSCATCALAAISGHAATPAAVSVANLPQNGVLTLRNSRFRRVEERILKLVSRLLGIVF